MPSRLIIFALFLVSCSAAFSIDEKTISVSDSIALINLVKQREKGMINRDINSIIQQFDTNASFINGGGFYYQGLNEIRDFHTRMFTNDSLTYTYKIGNITIKPIQASVAVVYYPWQQQWTMRKIKSDTLNEVGLMTLIAIKNNKEWKWKSITNQRTKEFFEDLQRHKQKPIQ